MNEPGLLTFDRWVFRLRPASGGAGRLLLLLHGWTGDENSMWVFARNLPAGCTVLAPRAPLAARQGGYSWREMTDGSWGFPSVEDLRPAAEALLEFVDGWSASASLDADSFDVIGFSQGAALTYVLALLHPGRVRALAALSGFLPLGSEEYLAGRPLAGKPVFVAHGTLDERIPVDRARSAVRLLQASGAEVTYCEAETGHKVSKDCLNGLEAYFGSIYNPS
jgi:phospholipase/carboxylesterase